MIARPAGEKPVRARRIDIPTHDIAACVDTERARGARVRNVDRGELPVGVGQEPVEVVQQTPPPIPEEKPAPIETPPPPPAEKPKVEVAIPPRPKFAGIGAKHGQPPPPGSAVRVKVNRAVRPNPFVPRKEK